ncbi:Non-specific serine/threonine protein kinase [Bertholletia excelsa]
MDQQEEPQPVQYPEDPDSYVLLEEIGRGVNSVVHKAHCRKMDSPEKSLVAIKCIYLNRWPSDLQGVPREAETMSRLSHPNVLGAHCSFMVDDSLWVVMPFMCVGSLQSIVASYFRDGLTEPCISVTLQGTLCGLAYLHMQGQLHRDIKAANILIDSNGTVRLADFPVSTSVYEATAGAVAAMLTDMAWKPYWIAPEVVQSPEETYSWTPKADIWSFGIVALELAYGGPPLSHLPSPKSLLMKTMKRFRVSNYYKKTRKSKDKEFSKLFKDMVGLCLNQDPSKRPSAHELLSHPFFRKCKGLEIVVKNILRDQRHRSEVWLQKFGSASKSAKEEISRGTEFPARNSTPKRRSVSGWTFNKDVCKLDPVFETTTEPVSNHSGGKTIVPDHMGRSNPSLPEKAAENGQREVESSGQNGGIEKSLMLEGLMALKKSLDVQSREVARMIALYTGEEAEDEQVERLKMELENKDIRNFELEIELNSLRSKLSITRALIAKIF